jgi:selenocysteine-specific elongation factor
MHVIGTAGHVDHGKSTLVQALTGIHPDRLKEEREREMTIDLGFAWMTLPDGEDVGIVDVPGHRDFIENMLAGVGGIDAALFVIAADEGIMPQTREHLAILDILQIQGGVIALTKIDLISDPEWLDLVEEDIRTALAGTVLAEVPIIRVSSRTRQGIPELIQAISACLSDRPPRSDLGRPRLPVDRVFTIPGFGTVVTGTLSDGRLAAGDEIQLLPGNLRGRVRGLQTHKKKEDIAVPGSRTAVNISGINVDQVQRGNVVSHPGDYHPTHLIDVHFRLLADITQALQHNLEVKLFLGAAEVVARLRLLGNDELLPGETGWLQLELSQPLITVRGDHYILRRPSPGETLGGGIVVDPHPKKRHKRFSKETLERLETLSQGTPTEILLQAMVTLGTATLQDVILRSNLESQAAGEAQQELLATGQLVVLEQETNITSNTLLTSRGYWDQLAIRAIREVENYHQANPLRQGMPREELKSRLKIPPRLFNATVRKLTSEKTIEENGSLILRTGHIIRFNPQQQKLVDGLLRRFAASPYSPPTLKECQTEVGEDIFNALIDLDQLVSVPPDVVFRREDYDHMVVEIKRLLAEQGTITAAAVRDHFTTSRRYALALLEYLDAQGLTVREGDVRRLK